MRLPSLLLPHSVLALLGFLAAALNALVRVAVAPLLIAPLFDRVLAAGGFSALPGVLWLGGLLVLAGALALWAQDALLGTVAARVSQGWREGVYRSLLARTFAKQAGTSGGLAGRLLSDLKEVETYLQFGLGTLVAESLTLLGSLAYLFYANARATLYLLAALLPLALALRFVGRRIERTTTRAQANLEEVSAHVQEGLRQREVARAFGLTRFLLGRFEPANRGTARAGTERAVWVGLQTPLAQVLGFSALALLLALLTRSVAVGTMSVGEVTAYVTLLALLSTPAQLLPRGYALLQGARAAKVRLETLALPDARPREALQAPPPRTPHVRLERASFTYDDLPVLHALSAEFRGPGLVAVAGASGGGKTTLLRLLLGFLTPTEGHVLLAGAEVGSYPDAELRRRLAYVPQDTSLFRGSLRDNLLLGRRYPDGALWGALRAVGLEEIVLERGLSWRLSEDGGGLSGGQKQRLAVARALLDDPDVLLLDEPSANLDAGSEAALVAMLKEQARRRLVIVVAHRPALLRVAREVYRLEHGTLQPDPLPA